MTIKNYCRYLWNKQPSVTTFGFERLFFILMWSWSGWTLTTDKGRKHHLLTTLHASTITAEGKNVLRVSLIILCLNVNVCIVKS